MRELLEEVLERSKKSEEWRLPDDLRTKIEMVLDPNTHGWTQEDLAKLKPYWHYESVLRLATAIHGESPPCERCLTYAAATVRTIMSNRLAVTELLKYGNLYELFLDGMATS